MTDEGKIAAELAKLNARFDRVESAMMGLLTRKLTRAQQAKKCGVSPVTLWRREQKLKLQQIANGPRHGAQG